jgi:phenylpropionate dioxygenase-like ring-hydroxylating dioxygenase large terminal subunit
MNTSLSAARLKPSDYYSVEQHDAEMSGIWESSWIFAGLKADFPAIGSYKTCQLGRHPLILLKNNKGELHVLHNVCRHRSTEILEGTGQLSKNITCPYHRWTYNLEGDLLAVPDAATCFQGLDRSQLGLKAGSIGFIGELVFIHPEPDQNFDKWAEPLKDQLWPHDLLSPKMGEAEPITYDIKCNWKVFAENALDGYHLAHLHSETLGGPRPAQNKWVPKGDHMMWYATDDGQILHSLPAQVRKSLENSRATKFKEAETPGYAGVYFMYPGTLVVPTPYSFSVTTFHPLSPTKVRLRVRNWFPKTLLTGLQSDYTLKDIPGYDPNTLIVSSDHWGTDFDPQKSDDFQTEDVWITEKMQRGLMSPNAQIGPLAQGMGAEDPLIWFQNKIMISCHQ